jgi:N-acetylglucosaminyldiphosphoundecaprenol N-acetyl-beta-D-mannosaminyltransferase
METRFDVLGTRVDALTPELATQRVAGLAQEGRGGIVVFCTVSTIMNARRNLALRKALEDADLVTPDGMPLVWLGRKKGLVVDRVYGPDFMLHFFSHTGARFSHFFYGGAPGVADEMAARLRRRFPSVRIVGTLSPPLGLDPDQPPASDIEAIKGSEADIVWIGLGHPKQELFMRAIRDRISVPVLAAVGAAFDFHAGRKKEAPAWMKESGLQWLHRLLSEPRRLWRRYLIGNAHFLGLLLLDALIRRLRRGGS